MSRYIMAVDYGGDDEKTFAVCVFDRKESIVKAITSTHNKNEFDEAVDRLKEYYGIPDEFVYKETA
jgi:hypothetical protein